MSGDMNVQSRILLSLSQIRHQTFMCGSMQSPLNSRLGTEETSSNDVVTIPQVDWCLEERLDSCLNQLP